MAPSELPSGSLETMAPLGELCLCNHPCASVRLTRGMMPGGVLGDHGRNWLPSSVVASSRRDEPASSTDGESPHERPARAWRPYTHVCAASELKAQMCRLACGLSVTISKPKAALVWFLVDLSPRSVVYVTLSDSSWVEGTTDLTEVRSREKLGPFLSEVE